MSYSEDLKIFKAMHTQLMHNPEMKYVSGGHLSTILKADDYVKAIRSFLQKKICKIQNKSCILYGKLCISADKHWT